MARPPLAPVSVSPLDELVTQVRGVLLDTLAIDIRDAEEDLIEGGVLDSLALVELLFELERRFDFVLVIGELDIESFRTLTSIAQFIADQTVARRLDEARLSAARPPRDARIRQPDVRDDLPQVAALYELVARSGSRAPRPVSSPTSAARSRPSVGGSRDPFARLRRGRRTRSPASSAATSAGSSSTRRRPPRVRRPARDRSRGAKPGGRILPAAGVPGRKQELAITDTAVDATRVMWTRIGGQLAHLQAISWFGCSVLRPSRSAT